MKRYIYLYPNEVVDYIKEHYKNNSDTKLCLQLAKLYPDLTFSYKTIISIRNRYGLVKSLTKRIAFLKVHETRSPKIGAILYKNYHGKKQWLIKVGPGKWRQYANILWKETYGKIPYDHRAQWKDENAPLVPENLHLVQVRQDPMPIGSVTVWKNVNRYRELIKVAPGVHELLLPHLWRKHHGEVPPGQYVVKIDPLKPTTIDNLRLTRNTAIDEGSKNLYPWYVRSTLLKTYPEGDVPETIMQWQKSKLLLLREIKKKIKELNAGNTERSTADKQVDGPCTEDD